MSKSSRGAGSGIKKWHLDQWRTKPPQAKSFKMPRGIARARRTGTLLVQRARQVSEIELRAELAHAAPVHRSIMQLQSPYAIELKPI